MALVSIGIDHLDLAFLDVDKAIHRLAGPREKRTRRIAGELARSAQRSNVRCGQRGSLHLAQVAANRFHVSSQSSIGPRSASEATILGVTGTTFKAGSTMSLTVSRAPRTSCSQAGLLVIL